MKQQQAQPVGFNIRMWGYLPSASPDKAPLLKPTSVFPSLSQSGWKAVCSGGCGFTLAISESGKLYSWSSTEDGQFYQFTGKHQGCPELICLPTESPFIYAAAGWAHCVAVTDDGEVFTWGWKDCSPNEKLTEKQSSVAFMKNVLEGNAKPAKARPTGTGLQLSGTLQKISIHRHEAANDRLSDEVSKKRKLSVEEVSSPESTNTGDDYNAIAPPSLVLFPQGVNIIKIAAGGRHTLALTDLGHVWGWGYGGEGQLGLGSRMCSIPSPQLIPYVESTSCLLNDGGRNSEGQTLGYVQKIPGKHIVDIACGGRHSVLLTDGGALVTFGWGLYGQCGQGSTDDELSPCYVSSLGGLQVVGVAAGLWHTLCITNTGDVYAFGGNQFGQLGVGGDQAEMFPRLVETSVLEEQNAICVSAGARHSAICTEEGSVFCWGWNKYGQLGLGDIINRDIPSQVPLEERACSVACGWWHTLSLVYAQ
ncbi:hypothetical protein O6H91_19G016700 [Diphasiastrum complanatum]|uniref:Uncharacterized protein n=1 Tax=Diphasiastrum complanatum TaxID=34168 RepID=A0ACC2AT21_DIPCM|nr:hypothetical protein O6H91_19G016700 [Diphasiastrum complanatum]